MTYSILITKLIISLVKIDWVAWTDSPTPLPPQKGKSQIAGTHSSLRNLPPSPINHYLPLAQADSPFDTQLPFAISVSTRAKSLIALFYLILINPKQFFCNEIWHHLSDATAYWLQLFFTCGLIENVLLW